MRRALAKAVFSVAGSSAFSPASIANLYSWYDAANVSLSGSLVTSWADAGTGFGAATPSGANKPSWTASNALFGGLPSVDWSGAAGYQLDTAAGILAQPCTHIVVVGASGVAWMGTAIDSTINTTRQLIWEASGIWQIYAGTIVSDGAITAGAHKAAFIVNGASSSLYVDDFTTPVLTGVSVGTNSLQYLRFGDSRPLTNPLNGSIPHAMCYSRVLTGGEIRQLGDWINGLTGLTG